MKSKKRRMQVHAVVKRGKLALTVLLFCLLSAIFVAQTMGVFGGSGGLETAWLQRMKEKRQGMEKLVDKIIAQRAKQVAVDELVQLFGNDLLLPTWMPGDTKLKKIYIWGSKTVTAILAYSDKDIENWREDNVTITLAKPAEPETLQNLEEHVKAYNEHYSSQVLKLIKIADIWAVMSNVTAGFWATVTLPEGTVITGWEDEPQPATAYFWYKDTYYQISGFISEDDIIGILEGMKPVI